MHETKDSMWRGILKTFWFSEWTKQGLIWRGGSPADQVLVQWVNNLRPWLHERMCMTIWHATPLSDSLGTSCCKRRQQCKNMLPSEAAPEKWLRRKECGSKATSCSSKAWDSHKLRGRLELEEKFSFQKKRKGMQPTHLEQRNRIIWFIWQICRLFSSDLKRKSLFASDLSNKSANYSALFLSPTN